MNNKTNVPKIHLKETAFLEYGLTEMFELLCRVFDKVSHMPRVLEEVFGESLQGGGAWAIMSV